MSMEITNNYSNYATNYADVVKKANGKPDEKEGAKAVERPNEEADKSVADYYANLQNNYSCLSQGNVSISSQYLKECAGNAGKAKELEDFLEKIPELEKQGYEELAARNKALGGTVTHYQQSWVINKDGSIQSTVYSVTETEETNAERLKRQMDERLEKQKGKKEEAENAEKAKEAKKDQQEKLHGKDDTVVKFFEQVRQPVEIKYIEVDSKEEALAMQNKEKVKDAYRPVLDVSV